MDIMDVESGDFINIMGYKTHIVSGIFLKTISNIKNIPIVKSHCGLLASESNVSTKPWNDVCKKCAKSCHYE